MFIYIYIYVYKGGPTHQEIREKSWKKILMKKLAKSHENCQCKGKMILL